MVYRKSKILIAVLALLIILNPVLCKGEGAIEESFVMNVINDLFKKRNNAILTKDEAAVKELYDISRRSGVWAFEHEAKKIKYLNNWSCKQAIVFKGIESNISIKWTRMKDNGNMIVNLLCATEYYYAYEDIPEEVNMMRIGAHHELELTEKDGFWHIAREWYTDPFADSLDPGNLKAEKNKAFILSNKARDLSKINKRRSGVVEYADKYCGAASNGENGYRYNPKYRNYNPLGGDCANFASQCMFEGGKLRKNSVWNYDKDGSMAWLSAQGLKDYLISSGRGSLIVSGNYNTVFKLSYKLLPGDIVAYEKKGKIVHVSVVTGADTRGYSLVNCHNTDRFRVPWDLGWSNSGIRFYFIRVNY